MWCNTTRFITLTRPRIKQGLGKHTYYNFLNSFNNINCRRSLKLMFTSLLLYIYSHKEPHKLV